MDLSTDLEATYTAFKGPLDPQTPTKLMDQSSNSSEA